MDKSFIIAPPEKKAYITLYFILAFIVGLMIQMLLAVGRVPGNVIWGILPVYVLLIGLFSYMISMMNKVRFIVRPNVLNISGDLWGRNIPVHSINHDDIRMVNLKTDRDYLPIIRTCGTGVPGYLSGWFRLKNGQKALLFVTDVHRIVCVNTTLGFVLMVSPDNPDEFVKALRRE